MSGSWSPRRRFTVFASLVARFILGGTSAAAFALAGDLFKPKTFAGLWSAAPSVALVSLALAYQNHVPRYVALEGRSMMLGAAGLVVYSVACASLAKVRRTPVWFDAIASWTVWFGAVFGAWAVLRRAGLLG